MFSVAVTVTAPTDSATVVLATDRVTVRSTASYTLTCHELFPFPLLNGAPIATIVPSLLSDTE